MRSAYFWGATLVACVTIVVLFGHHPGAAQQQPQQRPANLPRWEYAMYYVGERGVGWNDGRGKITDDDAYAVYRRLGGEAAKEDFALADLFHLWGQDGWELVLQDSEANTTVYWFKRRAIQ